MKHNRTAKSHTPDLPGQTNSSPRRGPKACRTLRRGARGASLPSRPGHLGRVWPIIH